MTYLNRGARVSKLSYIAWILLTVLLQLAGCRNRSGNLFLAPTLKNIGTVNEQVSINATTDTLSFALDDSSFTSIRNFSVFTNGGVEYVAGFDERSLSVLFFNLATKNLTARFSLKRRLKKFKPFKTTVWAKNFDSVYIINNNKIFLADTSGKIKGTAHFETDPPLAWAYFRNEAPGMVIDGKLIAGIRPYPLETSPEALTKWRILYAFDMTNGTTEMQYNFPEFMRTNLYGQRFLESSYCINDSNHLVFSFPPDTLIYETDLKTFHTAYPAKSKHQLADIAPVAKKYLENDEGRKQYNLRDAYRAIFYDRHAKRYLRIMRSGTPETEYDLKNVKKHQYVIVLDQHFRVVGESELPYDISLTDLLFTASGDIYALVKSPDENALHFLRLQYEDLLNNKSPLAHKY